MIKKILLSVLLIIICFSVNAVHVVNTPLNKNVLIIMEGTYDLTQPATAEALQLYNLMGHFHTTVTISGAGDYSQNEIKRFDIVFIIGFKSDIDLPATLINDILKTDKTVVWINSGLNNKNYKEEFVRKYGFSIIQLDKSASFNSVKSGIKSFTRGVSDIFIVQVLDKNKVKVLATAHSDKLRKETPYIIQSGNLYYVADMPFLNATEADRYLLFADLLHDFIGENHPVKHHAIVRIEDVTPMDSPNKLHDIADILSERDIPFVIGLVPFYVDPTQQIRVSLSERPEMVEALKYCVQNGATILMHGVTHQYRGISTNDYEFWDGTPNKPIEDEDSSDIANKIEAGINECIKNGIYPLLWETPHYAASILSYQTIAKYFSTAMEQRLVIENIDYGQYFPYVIYKDIYGQKIYPENLGYLPLEQRKDSSENYVHHIIDNAKVTLNVRDGYAAFFFHSFLNLNYLKEIVDGMVDDNFSYLDFRQETNWVKTKDKIILSGSQSYKLYLNNSYLYEIYYDKRGKIKRKSLSNDRISGEITRDIKLDPGEFYMAEPLEYRIKDLTIKEEAILAIKKAYKDIIQPVIDWKEARVKVCWNEYAKGAAYNDQSSLVSIFRSVNIKVDSIFIRKKIDLTNTNVLIVPYAYADSLTNYEVHRISEFVKQGGCLITDRKTKLSNFLSIKFLDTEIKVHAVRDNLYPQEHISWADNQLIHKFETKEDDEVYAIDGGTGSALVIGRQIGKGKLLFFSTPFDANSALGYSRYPFGLEYAIDYFKINPVIRKDNLEFYFDPGTRHNISIESLVKMWVRQGIRIVHAAGYQEWPKWTYDYDRLIRLAHANGILVIAWFEPPQVSKKFWDNNPGWHEKNYKGEEIKDGWRFPVTLTNEACLKAAISEYLKLLIAYDWDGVNIAELCFGSDKGFGAPEKYLPMNASACKEVKDKYNIDLKKIFDPSSQYYWKNNNYVKESVTQYRMDQILYEQEKILQAVTTYAKTKPGFQVIITTFDSYGTPSLKETIGINSEYFVALQKKYGFHLQIEDDASRWVTDPRRYEKIGEMYTKLIGDKTKLLLDLNLCEFRDKDVVTPFPTLIPTGIESYQLVNSSSIGSPRSTIYCEATANPQDISLFPYADASFVEYENTDNGYEVNSPQSFTMKLPNKIKVIKIDDLHEIGMRDNEYLIPAGKHIISFGNDELPGFSTAGIQPQIVSFTGNLLSFMYAMRSIDFEYESDGRALVSLSEPPSKVNIDEQPVNFIVMKGRDCYSIFLPEGKHVVKILTGNSLSYGISLTSLWSTNAIVMYGGLAILLITIMYWAMKIIRRKYED